MKLQYILESDLRLKYPNMDEFHIGYLISYDNALKRNKLYEGLIMSHDANRVIRILIKKFNYLNNKIIHMVNNDIKIHVSKFSSNINNSFLTDIDKLINLTSTLGWFLSHIQITDINGTFIIPFNKSDLISYYTNTNVFQLNVYLEAKFNLKPHKLPSILYHIAPTDFRDSIAKRGLQPKNNNVLFDYPKRLYLFTDYKLIDYQIRNFKNNNNYNEYDIYSVKYSGRVKQLRFLIDPKLKGAVYTLEPISTIEIKLIDTK